MKEEQRKGKRVKFKIVEECLERIKEWRKELKKTREWTGKLF